MLFIYYLSEKMAKKETMNFDADVAQLIKLVTHSIYSNTDIFLRELLSNSNDAIQKARMLSLQDTSYLWDETDLQITIETDPDAKTITITDTGIGMSRDEVISNIGTIAKSWTKAFLESLEKNAKAKKDAKKDKKNESWSTSSDLIGQFGIGFYSSFMVAKKVELETKANGSDAVKWTSEGDGAYELADSDKKTRGTTITLFLNNDDDNDAYADYYRLRWLIKTHSNYVPVPIMMKKLEEMKPTDEREQINQMQSLWTKQKSTIKQEEYDDFFKTMTYSQEWPLDTIHVSIEWLVNFKALLYIPKQPGMFEQMQWANEQEYGPSLYVQNVLVIEKAKELLPVRLRFVKWVVETPDLSLNVSREILQDNKILEKIKQALIKEVLKSLSYIAKTEPDAYANFFAHYGRYLKEWVHYEREFQDDIAWLLLYATLEEEKPRTFAQITENTKKDTPLVDTKENETPDDKETSWEKKEQFPLYYLTWKSLSEIRHSPYLEQFKTHKTDVILMWDPLDEYVVNALQEYNDFKLVSASSPDVHLWDQAEQEEKKKETEKKTNDNKDILESFAKTLGEEKIEKVEFTHKIWNNLWVLVTPEWMPSPQMERIMKSMGQDVPPTKRILQVNDEHPLIKKILAKWDDSEEVMKYVYEQAILLEWWELEDMAGFVKRVNGLIGS